jgi:protein tyrosine phosphatase (PTP) superfamily phosphohydrolase (DUF442 family)
VSVHRFKVSTSKQKKPLLLMLVFFLIVVAGGYCLVLFKVRGNFREVVPGKVYRSGQPTPAQLREWVNRYKIKTVLNLRGREQKIIEVEEAVARELGLNMISMCVSSHRLPARYIVLNLIKNIESVELPVLIHCRSGVDRAGTASALAAMARGNVEYDVAKWHAYVAPGPWKRKKHENRRYFQYYFHISDIFKLYESYCKRNNLDANNWQQLKQWVVNTKSLPEVEPQ